jgi:hypothetical protein
MAKKIPIGSINSSLVSISRECPRCLVSTNDLSKWESAARLDDISRMDHGYGYSAPAIASPFPCRLTQRDLGHSQM